MQVDLFAKLTESGIITGVGHGGVQITQDQRDKAGQRLADFFDPEKLGEYSLKECYVDLTGDNFVTGRISECDQRKLRENFGHGSSRLTESITSSTFAEMMEDTLNKRVQIEYSAVEMYDAFQAIASMVPVNDFREQNRPVIGGYGSLPTVAEAAAYGALTSPTDTKESYSVGKRGGTEVVTLEAIKNDDANVVAGIPRRLAVAAKRTLCEFAFNFFVTNPNMTDAAAWVSAAHNNIGTTALSSAAISAGRLAMMNQTERDSGKKAPVLPSLLLLPFELQEAGFDILGQRGTNNDKSFLQEQNIKIVTVPTWTDVNNWFLLASPSIYPALELGFLDNKRDPEIFLQNDPSSGSVFSNDQLTYKIKHVYSGVPLAYQPVFGSIVA